MDHRRVHGLRRGELQTGVGSGTITGNLSVTAGTVSPGRDGAIGTLNVTGNCTLNNSTLNIDVVVSAGSVVGYDQLVVNTVPGGALTIQGGTLNVNIIEGAAPPYIPANGLTVNIIQFLSVTGDFAAFNTAYSSGFWDHRETGTTYQLIARTFS
jgi:hypothetical protein